MSSMNITHTLMAKSMGVNSHHELVAFMRSDCHVCRSEGFEALASIQLGHGEHTIIAKLYVVDIDQLDADTVGLSHAAFAKLKLKGGESVKVTHAPVVNSLSSLRAKIFNQPFSEIDLIEIVGDIAKGHYNDIEISSFVTACGGDRLSIDEITWLTNAMVKVGEQLDWGTTPVLDKHCVGGLPGNRTTPIVVSIVAANGLLIPKTSSRAITSPAGTADTMEILTRVDLDLCRLRQVVKSTGASLAWGGSVKLSPVDDVLIRVEKVLDLDSEGQLIASVLSKKIAAGSTHVLIDIPTGASAKVRTVDAAENLSRQLIEVGKRLNLKVETIITDGNEPVGQGIGAGLEARDVLKVLKGEGDAPENLKERALTLAGLLLEMGNKADKGQGKILATNTLDTGKAWQKFMEICLSQGGLKQLDNTAHTYSFEAQYKGVIKQVDNRKLARLAKLAGAPASSVAGVDWKVRLGQTVEKGQSILDIHAETKGELNYAYEYLVANEDIVIIGE
ncbi:thymidine phosphorylase family protein [Alkalimarinus alittae]|uniref:Putative thymidine phosphorylase n=1 Tax=Alkalimarinus alittae TaxID=2961619 RepID=A0ABY6MXF2_9ALTE|nr:thymidine phosphorylase family protein [Alkalimarinus alittae]UZE94512.1 thymidine phosphorylase family protein [Alkalimarinus alittae]